MTDLNQVDNGIRWAHFGGCVNGYLFNEERMPLMVSACGNRSIRIYELYQRNMAAIVGDWAYLEEHPALLKDATEEEELFLSNWLPSVETFQSTDLLFANVVSDLLYQFTTLSFQHQGLGKQVASMEEVIFNYPLEPSTRLLKHLGMRQTSEDENLAAWVKFASSVQVPVVMLLFGTQNRVRPVYAESHYEQLNRYQNRLSQALGHLPNWYFLEVDALLESNPIYYLNRHHLTGSGYARLRLRLLEMLGQEGLFASLKGGPPLERFGHGIPDRCDIKRLLPDYWEKIASIYQEVALVGPERLTVPIGARLQVLGLSVRSFSGLGQVPASQPPEALIYLRWSQSKQEPGWLVKMRARFPLTFFELPSEWKKMLLMSEAENKLRSDLRNECEGLSLEDVPQDPLIRRYLARVLMETHYLEKDILRLRDQVSSKGLSFEKLKKTLQEVLNTVEKKLFF